MTITRTSLLKTLVLAGMALAPLVAQAQGTRTPTPAAPPRATPPRQTPAPAPGATTSSRTTASSAVRPWNEQEYRLGPGDKLRVEVYREPQLSQSLQVRPDGKVTLPLVGDLPAAGRTSIELRDALTTSLKEYVTNPVVTVIVVEATAAQVFVVGEVSSPGTQVMQGPLTVLQALAQAGGLKEFANAGDIRILRKAGTGPQQTIEFDYKAALKGKIDPVYLQPGDTIVVP
jgi:polysaccharide biosynthesis/export protein